MVFINLITVLIDERWQLLKIKAVNVCLAALIKPLQECIYGALFLFYCDLWDVAVGDSVTMVIVFSVSAFWFFLLSVFANEAKKVL